MSMHNFKGRLTTNKQYWRRGRSGRSNPRVQRKGREGAVIIMDARGRAFDNIFVKRPWRSVKHEDVYLKGYASMSELTAGLAEYFVYNGERPHRSLGNLTLAVSTAIFVELSLTRQNAGKGGVISGQGVLEYSSGWDGDVRHLLVNDAAAGGHPLHVAGADKSFVSQAVAMLHQPFLHISGGIVSVVGYQG